LFRTKKLDVEVETTQTNLKNLSIQEGRAPTPVIEEVLDLNPTKDHQQCKVIIPREDKNQNGKRNLVAQITGKKARKIRKNKTMLEKLQEAPGKTS
jgi:hypothetical protein